jgi:hypothetical protein
VKMYVCSEREMDSRKGRKERGKGKRSSQIRKRQSGIGKKKISLKVENSKTSLSYFHFILIVPS